jgi:hypothetical protein
MSKPALSDLNVDDYKVLTKLSRGGWFEVSPEDCRKISAIQKLFNGNLVIVENASTISSSSTVISKIRFKAKAELLNWLQGE